MVKYILIGIAIVACYLVFIKGPYPSDIHFQGVLLGSKQGNNDSLNKEIDMFSYRDSTNHHVLLFAILNGSSIVTLPVITNQYIDRFRSQGFKIQQDESRYKRVQSDTVMYITLAKKLNAFIAYTTKGGGIPRSINDASEILFRIRESFILSTLSDLFCVA